MAVTSRPNSGAHALLFALFLCAVALDAQQLPTTQAKTLSGRSITLPVPDRTQTFLVVGFSKASSDPVKAWWLQAKAICQAHSAVACYEAAVIEDAPSFVRGMIISGMKHGMDPDRQDTFVTVPHRCFRPSIDETCKRVGVECFRVEGIEVGMRLVRISPCNSRTRNPLSTPDCRHGQFTAPEHAF